ncbi:MAG: ATP-binding protein [Bdellovibrionia bacterium]
MPTGSGLDWLSGGGKMGDLFRATDWSKTQLGPADKWPQSLRTTVSLCLSSRFPTVIYWGPQFLTFYNDSYAPILGTKHPWALGLSVKEVWAEIWEEHNGPMLNGVISSGVATWSEDKLLNLHRRGFLEETYFTYSFAPVTVEGGARGGIFCTCTETTERVIAERRLKLLRELGEAVLGVKTVDEACRRGGHVLSENSPDTSFAAIFLLEPDGRTLKLASSNGPIPKQIDLTAISIPSQESIWQLGKVIQNGKPETVQFVKDGVRAAADNEPHSVLLVPITHRGNENVVYGVLLAGLSPRLPIEENYISYFHLVAAQIAAFISTTRAYEEATKRSQALAEIDRLKTEFFSNVSHEFGTPLTLMLGPVEDILAGNAGVLTPQMRAEAEVVHRNALRLLKLVNNLLDFSRIEAGRAQASYEPLDLGNLTRDLASGFQSSVERVGLKFKIESPSLSEPVFIDREMWEKTVFNLLSNAFKFTLKGEIKVQLKKSEEAALLTVSDTGLGIPADELPKLFQRFHRVQGAEGRTHEGTGIGLALVQELVKLHGGTIRVESTHGKGTAFFISIPFGKAHLPKDRIFPAKTTPAASPSKAAAYVEDPLLWSTEDLQSLSDSGAPPETNGARKKRVIVADDNRDMRNYVAKLLQNTYEVIPVADGQLALEAARKTQPDLVVSDVMMPVMNGIELLQNLRADLSLQKVPVILLSARAGDESKTSGLELGADDYITKPFSAGELRARVRTQLHLSEMRTRLLSELENSNQELDAFSRSVSHDLRAPLRGMAGFSKILLEDHGKSLEPRAREYLERIALAAEKMGRLVDGLLKLSRLSRGELQKRTVDLSKIVETIAAALKENETTRTVQVVVKAGLSVRGDPQLLEVAVQNLLSNAFKFTSKTPSARVEFGELDGEKGKIYFVRDNGAGFDMKYADRLFGTFQRLHSENEFEGTGVGLATVHRIIKRHDGKIWAEAKPGEGATFFFAL